MITDRQINNEKVYKSQETLLMTYKCIEPVRALNQFFPAKAGIFVLNLFLNFEQK